MIAMKRIHLICLVLISVLFPVSALASGYVKGDVDENGQVTIADVVSLISYLLTEKWVTDTPAFQSDTIPVGDMSLVMIRIEGGTFTMGAADDAEAYEWEMPAHEVTLTGYWMSETEVTQQLWQVVMGENPSHFTGDDMRPVESVSWNDCQEFIRRLNEMTGKSFRLPTSAEWEFAARGGIHAGGSRYAGSDIIDEVAWFSANSYALGPNHPDYGTHAVASKKANELGLYDMSGNVHEWCSDWYEEYSDAAQFDPAGAESGTYRVLRGGCWSSEARRCRVSYFNFNQPGNSSATLGLRLVLTIE